jgi:hypothetical protein
MYTIKRYGWSVSVLVLLFALTARAADITGTWAIQDLQVADKVQFSLYVNHDGKGSFSSSSGLDVSQLLGLTRSQIAASAGTTASFELVREAGTFSCEGYFKDSKGAGTFQFRPNPSFIGQMAALGFGDIDEERLFSLAVHDIGPRFASEIRTTGTNISTVDQLVSMRIHGVTAEFIRGIQQSGYKPEPDELVKLRIHGVTTDFVNGIRRIYSSAQIDDFVRMRIHGVELDFAADVRQAFPTASIDDLVGLRIHGITMDYIRNMQSRLKNVTLEQIVMLKIHGIG